MNEFKIVSEGFVMVGKDEMDKRSYMSVVFGGSVKRATRGKVRMLSLRK